MSADRVPAKVLIGKTPIPTLTVALTERGEILEANDSFVGTFGHTRDQLLGSSVDSLVPPKHREKHKNYRLEFMNGNARPRIMSDRASRVTILDHAQMQVYVRIGLTLTDDQTAVVAIVMPMAIRSPFYQSPALWVTTAFLVVGLLISLVSQWKDLGLVLAGSTAVSLATYTRSRVEREIDSLAH